MRVDVPESHIKEASAKTYVSHQQIVTRPNQKIQVTRAQKRGRWVVRWVGTSKVKWPTSHGLKRIGKNTWNPFTPSKLDSISVDPGGNWDFSVLHAVWALSGHHWRRVRQVHTGLVSCLGLDMTQARYGLGARGASDAQRVPIRHAGQRNPNSLQDLLISNLI